MDFPVNTIFTIVDGVLKGVGAVIGIMVLLGIIVLIGVLLAEKRSSQNGQTKGQR
jgi:hypothetical protein